jgi:hypothetical protein
VRPPASDTTRRCLGEDASSGPAAKKLGKGRTLTYTDILLDALQRATFAQDLCWREPGAGFGIEHGSAADRVNDTFRFDDTPADLWLELQASAQGPNTLVPCIKARVRIPVPEIASAAGFAAANDASRLGLAAVYFDAPAAALIVQQAVVFTGYHDSEGLHADAGAVAARREAALNMFASLFTTAHACLQFAYPEADDPPTPLLRVVQTSPEVLDTFASFVISRMVRWDIATLRPDSPAFQRALASAAYCHAIEITEADETQDRAAAWTEADEAESRQRVAGWLLGGRQLGKSDAMQFDSVLFDIDRNCRWALRDVMADPPRSRPLRQLQLLEKALAERAAVWDGLVVHESDLKSVIGLGLDLEAGQVPDGYAQRLMERFAFPVVRAVSVSRLPPEQHWLTRSTHGILAGGLVRRLRLAMGRTGEDLV